MQETTLSKDDERITRIDIIEEAYSTRYGFDVSTDEEKAFSGSAAPSASVERPPAAIRH